MKLYVDDRRQPTGDYEVLARTVERAIHHLQSGEVTHLSLDHDLGGERNGVEVLDWIQREMTENGLVPPEVMVAHSANPAGRAALERAIESIRRQQAREGKK